MWTAESDERPLAVPAREGAPEGVLPRLNMVGSTSRDGAVRERALPAACGDLRLECFHIGRFDSGGSIVDCTVGSKIR